MDNTLEFLIEIDLLVKLIESPAFICKYYHFIDMA